MSDSLDHQDHIDSLVREIAAEKARPKPDKGKLRKWCREIERLEGGYPRQQSSVSYRKPRRDEDPQALSTDCAMVQGELVNVVAPPEDTERDQALGLIDSEPRTLFELEKEAQLAAGRMFYGILSYFLAGKRDLAVIGKKVVIFAHFLAPDLLDGIKTADLATEFGCSKQEISRIGTAMREKLGVRSSLMRGEKSRANMAAAALDLAPDDDCLEPEPIDREANDEFLNPLLNHEEATNDSNA